MNDGEVRVLIALIHNNNMERNAYVRPQLEKMVHGLNPFIAAKKIEISFQPELKAHGTAMAFMRDLMYRKLDREWHRYRLVKPLTLLRDFVGFLKGSLIKYVIEYDKIGKPWKTTSAIEVLVTDKHVRAWGAFLDTRADFLLCFEDDVIFKGDSVQRINELFGALRRRNLGAPIYVDLAGGCKLDELRIDNLASSQDAYFRHYSKPVTNTACAYLVSRDLVAAFHSILTRRPWLRLIGADWMMNSLFVRLDNDGVECVCMHAAPTIFEHGTATGEYVSSIR